MEQRNDYRVIKIDLNVVPAEEHEIEEPEEEHEEESSDEDYDLAADVEENDESLASLVDPALLRITTSRQMKRMKMRRMKCHGARLERDKTW